MAVQNNFKRELLLKQILLEEIAEDLQSQDIDEVQLSLERVSQAIKELEIGKDKAMNSLMEMEDLNIETLREWSQQQKKEINPFKEMRTHLKERISILQKREKEHKLQEDLKKQQQMMEEAARLAKLQQQQQEEARKRQMQMEEDWMHRKLQMEQENVKLQNTEPVQKQPTVKLQKYTITQFQGDFKDWLRFWNQFTVEVDGSGIAEISKFNYLLELVQGKPRDDILGLPHMPEGYKEAKKILQTNYGKDIKVRKALIQELEGLGRIININQTRDIHEFYNKLARIVRTLATMKKLQTAQSHVYTVMDKLGPVKEALVSKDDD